MSSTGIFAYRGGGFDRRVFAMDCLIVEHRQGILVCEGGFGRRLDDHLRTVPWLMRTFSSVQRGIALADQLKIRRLAPEELHGIVLTHTHWDHVGAIDDLPTVPVWVNKLEHDFIHRGGHQTALLRSFRDVNFSLYDFTGGPFAGFDRSHDFFGDGTVVAVPVGGHTPGSVLIFVRTTQVDYVLVGDQAWQREGIETIQEKPWVTGCMVDHNRPEVRGNLAMLHGMQKANPELVLVPSHDRRVTANLERFTIA